MRGEGRKSGCEEVLHRKNSSRYRFLARTSSLVEEIFLKLTKHKKKRTSKAATLGGRHDVV